MKNPNYRPRFIDEKIQMGLKIRGAVALEGPKWCGKTWSCLENAESCYYVGAAAGNFKNRKLAENDLSIALKGSYPHLIDEWQVVPALWDAVRVEVDRIGKPGLFLLTGSSTPMRKSTFHSGTGRIMKIRMRSMSLYESGDSDGKVSLNDLFSGTVENYFTGEIKLSRVAELVARGGWPGAIHLTGKEASASARDYISAFLEEDLPRIDDSRHTRDGRKIRFLLESLARNEGTTASVARLCRDISAATDTVIKEETVNEYLDILERCFLVENQEAFAFSGRSGSRLKLAPKRHLTDPSLACALLSMNADSLLNDLATFGFMFESMAERDLAVYAEALDGTLSHYQDYKGREIDAVIKLSDGRWGAFEIKLGTSQIDAAAANLLKIKKTIETDNPQNAPSFLAVISGLSNAVYQREDGVYVLPLTSLKP